MPGHFIYDYRGKKCNIEELAGKLKGKYIQSFTDSDGNHREVKCTGISVSHQDLDHDVMLVMERFSEIDVRFYITNRVDTTRKGVMDAIRLYRKRWRIEEVFRFAKQEFRLEKYLVRSMNAMNVLSSIVALAVNFITEIIMRKEEAFISRDRFALELYHIGTGLRYIMGHAEKRPETKRRIRRKLAEQLTIFNS